MKTLRKSIEQAKIAPFYTAWAQLEKEIKYLHSSKKNSPAAQMTEGLILYKSLLKQCSSGEEKIEPLNNSERLAFIEANCSKYAAFRQLQELFNELHKKIASKRAILNKL